MQTIIRRLSSLVYLFQPLALTLLGVVLLSLGFAYLVIHVYRTIEFPELFYYLTLQFLPRPTRGILLLILGVGTLGIGIWRLSGVVVIPLSAQQASSEVVVGYRRTGRSPRVAVLSGGAGVIVLSSLGEHIERLTCITPIQDPVEYYWRASSLITSGSIYFVAPSPVPVQVFAELDDATLINIKYIDVDPQLAPRYVKTLMLRTEQHLDDEHLGVGNGIEQTSGQASSSGAQALSSTMTVSLPLTRLALEAIREADAIVLGPGSLFESILPNMLIDELREALQQSKARKIYICNLMTEPGFTTGFSVGEHIRQIKRYGGFTPDYALVNAQRIEPAVYKLYEAANQLPVYLNPEEYEETVVFAGERLSERHIVVEGSLVFEADLSSSVIQHTVDIDKPDEVRAVRVLRHDGQKLAAAILELLKRGA